MKTKILAFLAAVGLAGSASAAISLSGSSLLNAPGLLAGQNAVYIVGIPGATIAPSTDLLTDLPGALGTNTSASVFGSVSLGSNLINLDQAPIQGQQFSVIVFGLSPENQAQVGDTYQFWTDPSWIIPAGDGGYSFGAGQQFAQLGDAADGAGAVVPEPSTYAMLAGALALVAVMIRRRK